MTLSKEGLPNDADCARRAVAARKCSGGEANGVQSEIKLGGFLRSLPSPSPPSLIAPHCLLPLIAYCPSLPIAPHCLLSLIAYCPSLSPSLPPSPNP